MHSARRVGYEGSRNWTVGGIKAGQSRELDGSIDILHKNVLDVERIFRVTAIEIDDILPLSSWFYVNVGKVCVSDKSLENETRA